jgi:hypothetical protein
MNRRRSKSDDERRLALKVYGAIGLIVLACIAIYITVSWEGVSRDCSGCWAERTGADWVIVQLDLNGRPFRCWELEGAAITNEERSDGIWWEDEHGNLVHISGLYNRVQVRGDNWDEAFASLGLTRGVCRAIRDHRVRVPDGGL